MWYLLLTVALTVATGSSEKLGDIEVITRDELTTQGLVPPDADSPFFEDIQPKSNLNIQNAADAEPENKFIPLPALSYLPPVQTPLPIESTSAPQSTQGIIVQQEYIAPEVVAEEILPVVETPNSLYLAPEEQQPNPVIISDIDPGVEIAYNTQAEPVASIPDPVQPFPQDEGYYLEETEVSQPGFLSGIRDSKLTLLGGIVGAKSAVVEGFKNAKESLYSGVTGALAAKAAAFSSLKNKGAGYARPEPVQINYGVTGNEGYGSNPAPGVAAGAELSPNYPLQPVPVKPEPSYIPPVTQAPTYVPLPVSAYPVYPPYPPQPLPVYAPPRPIYRPLPNPLSSLKAKIEGIVQAKRDAVAGAIAKVKEAKEGFKQKVGGIFNKGQPAYIPIPQNRPSYDSSHGINVRPALPDLFHKYSPPMTYHTYETRPTYDATISNTPSGVFADLEAKVASKKASISSAIARAIAKLKAPFQPRYRYGYREW